VACSLDWLVAFVGNLQNESQAPRALALQEAERAYHHNKAADYGMHDQPYLPVPAIPPPSLMNAHCFVEQFIKPLTESIQAPLYTRIPPEHVGPPEIFISHAWNALLVGPDGQEIGTIDALARPLSRPKPTYVWIDVICYNQHLVETIAPDMERVVGEIGRIGFAATPVPLLNRSWCLWELLCSERTGASPEVFVHAGYRNDKILSVNALFRSFAGVEGSQSSSPRDRADIFDAFLKQFGSFEASDAHIEALIREKLSAPWFELHERDADLQFRPYPWLYDQGSDEAGRAAGIEKWKTFDPYFTPTLRESVLLGSRDPVFDMLIGAGLHVSNADRTSYELAHADTGVLGAFEAAARGDTATLARLLEAGIDVNARLLGERPLHAAARAGHADAVRLLLDRGADAQIATNEARQMPLHMAALNGHRDVAAALLDAGVAVDPKADNDATPLHMAADKGHLDVVRLLVGRGATIDAPNAHGWTALFWAASCGHAEIVTYLLEQGANAHVVATRMRATPLHLAAQNGHANVANLLLGAGVAISPRASNGATPLHYAVQNGDAAMARLLLDYRAETGGATDKGVTLIDLARSSGMPEDILGRLK
jgi:ankyrin repeat protein